MEELILNRNNIQINEFGEIKYYFNKETGEFNLPWLEYNDKHKLRLKTDILTKYIKYGKFDDGDNFLNYYFVSSSLSKTPNVYIYENGKYTMVSDNLFIGEICKFVPASLRTRNIKSEILNELLSSTPKNRYANIEDFYGKENYINFKDGILDIKTKQLLPHTPKYKCIIQINANYNEIKNSTKSPVFDNYLDTLCDGDEICKKILLQILGIIISNIPGHYTKKMLILKGKGNTGKSQLKKLAEYLVGDEYVNTADLAFLSTNRFAVANLYGKRLAGCNDMSTENIKGLDVLKKLTGGDKIFADIKNGTGFDFVFNGFLWFNTNVFPSFGGDKGKWVYERIIPIECNNVIPENKQDPNLFAKMLKEKNAIINKALVALDELIANNFKFPKSEKISQIRKQYQENNSPVLQFISEVCIRSIEGSKEKTKRSMLYDNYRQWCNFNNYPPKSKIKFKEELESSLDEDGKTFFCLVHNVEYARNYILDIKKMEEIKKEYNRQDIYNSFLTDDEAYAIENGTEALEKKKIIEFEEKKHKQEMKKKQFTADYVNKYQNVTVDDCFMDVNPLGDKRKEE